MCRRAWAAGWILAAGGCLPESEGLTRVVADPFTQQAYLVPTTTHIAMSPGTQESADRLITIGGRIVNANRSFGLRPSFLTIGQPTQEVFHSSLQVICITEGLVKRCQSDDQLAAVLCHELGRMIAERESRADPQTRQPGDRLPQDVPVGNDYGGTFGSPDGTRHMELAKIENARRKREEKAPNPDDIARTCLRNAGYKPEELDTVAPLLKSAEGNFTLERQMTGK
jgi:hypothetical protein